MGQELKIGQRVRVRDRKLWCGGFTGSVITITIEHGDLIYWVKPDPECSAAAKLQFRPEQLELA